MKTVVFASFAKFPNGDSNAIHLVNMGTIFSNIGYATKFVGFGSKDSSDTFGKYLSLNVSHKNNLISKISNHIAMDRKIYSFLKKLSPSPDVIVISGSLSNKYYKKLANHFEKKSPNTQLLISMTEQYTKDEFDHLSFLVKRGYKRNQYLNEKFSDKRYKMLCISRYLYSHFKGKGFKSLFLPFVFSNKYIGQINSNKHDKLNFIYSGSPDNKDRLIEMLNAFSGLSDEYKRIIHLNLLGVDENWINKKEPNLLNKIKEFTTVYGRKDYTSVKQIYSISDYSILLRDDKKLYAMAGCPTKVTESLFFKVVPITNLTGDLKDYLIDNKNAFIVKQCSTESFKKGILRAIENKSNINIMKKNCYETSQEFLESSNYNKKLEDFLKL